MGMRRIPKTGDGKKMMGVMIVMNYALESTEVVDRARDGDRSFLVEAILVFGLLQEPSEQRMVNINDRNHEPLLLLADENCQTPLGSLHLVPMMMVVKVRQMNMEMEIQMQEVLMLVATAATASTAAKPHRN